MLFQPINGLFGEESNLYDLLFYCPTFDICYVSVIPKAS